MAIFKCKMCGGDLNVQEGVTVCKCEYCENTQTVPTADNEKKVNLFNRANRLRSSCEFDKAAGVYESIVAEFPKESEAYWGLCLCKYGIEYVDDPETGNKIPTCHRTSFDSIFDDSNFKMAQEHADAIARSVCRDEAKEIDRLQKEILEIAKNEEPFDVFICYKESDESGQRTIDSELAHDIYDVLTEKGYKVFYSRITLKARLGQDYEPYIFSALNSAKVMLAIGTNYDYYNAVWVKNEWSRYLALMSNDKGKMLIPCYKDIDAYDMPSEFKHLQAQDLSSPRAFQDLVNVIEKLIPLNNSVQTISSASASTVEPLIKRAFMCLEDGQWQKADELCEQVLNQEPENVNAYLCKLLSEYELNEETALATYIDGFTDSDNYSKIIRFGDSEIKNRIEEYRITSIYNRGCSEMSAATSESEYREAKEIFESVRDFKDAPQKFEECELKANQIVYDKALLLLNSPTGKEKEFKKAKEIFLSLGDFTDSVQKANECEKRIDEWRKSEKEMADNIISKFERLEKVIRKYNSNTGEINTEHAKAENKSIIWFFIPFIIALIVCIAIIAQIVQEGDGLIAGVIYGLFVGVIVFIVALIICTLIWNGVTNSHNKKTNVKQAYTTKETNIDLYQLGVKGTFESDCKIRICPQCGAIEISSEEGSSSCYKCGFDKIIVLENGKISEVRQSIINKINKCHHINL